MSVIRLKDVVMEYVGEDNVVMKGLDGVSVDIDEGEFVFLIGESGAGKSSLLKTLIREEKIKEGYAVVCENDVGKLADGKLHLLRRDVGCVFQDFKLIPGKTVEENVRFVLDVIGMDERKAREKVIESLKAVGMEDKKDKYPRELSGGQVQRVAIARAIVNEPRVLLADEPTGNLDPENTDVIFTILKDISEQGTAVLVTTHSKEIVNREKRRVVEMNQGRIVRDDLEGVYEG